MELNFCPVMKKSNKELGKIKILVSIMFILIQHNDRLFGQAYAKSSRMPLKNAERTLAFAPHKNMNSSQCQITYVVRIMLAYA